MTIRMKKRTAKTPNEAKIAKLVKELLVELGEEPGRGEPDAETVKQALAYRKALARRPDWNHPIAVAVVEVCGNIGYNWFDLPT